MKAQTVLEALAKLRAEAARNVAAEERALALAAADQVGAGVPRYWVAYTDGLDAARAAVEFLAIPTPLKKLHRRLAREAGATLAKPPNC